MLSRHEMKLGFINQCKALYGIDKACRMESVPCTVWNQCKALYGIDTLCRELSLGLASVLVKANHGACETGREGTNAQSSAYFVRHSRSPKILADFNGGPGGAVAPKNRQKMKRACFLQGLNLISLC